MKKPEIQELEWSEELNSFITFIPHLSLAPLLEQLRRYAQFS